MLPVAGPFLGARKSYRAVLSGEDFGLGSFLQSDEVTLAVGHGARVTCLSWGVGTRQC